MKRSKLRLDKDPLDLALEIKRGFERTVASNDRPARIDGDYVLGVAVWWFVIFAALSIVGVGGLPAAIVAGILCWFWPVVLLLGGL
ncbi:MAG TPA: hypothetical protein VFB13_05135 [Reyranella sp.]|jgi:hypothetical protein|nr:hypothetical protein [Reyranella sp.]